MLRKSNGSKKEYEKRKRRKKVFKFLKEYSSVIMIFITIFAFIPNVIIWYYQKVNSSDFVASYLSVYIDSDNWVKTYVEKNGDNSLFSELVCPTVNNSINQVLYKYPDKVKDYYVTYLIINQIGETSAEDVEIKFKEYEKKGNLENNSLSDLKITDKKGKIVYKKFGYPFSKDEKVKIPISICKVSDLVAIKKDDCYYIEDVPISIKFKNKYMLSSKTVKIRPYIEHNVIIDGYMTTGKGSA